MRAIAFVCLLTVCCSPKSQGPAPSTGPLLIPDVAPREIDLDPPEMQVTAEGQEGKPFEALGVTQAEIETEIVGLTARTRLTLTFFNPHNRVLEGELVLPLPEDATVSGYGLDIQGQMVDAVVVAKEKARIVFEKEVRKGVDPGIVEWVGGNVFRTRVYPVPAKGTRTVAIEYVRHLEVMSEEALFQVPLSFAKGLERLALRIMIPNSPTPPQLDWVDMTPIPLVPRDNILAGELALQGQPLKGRLQIRVPRKGRAVAVEQMPGGGSVHFLVAEPLGNLARESVGDARRVSRLVVYWDASHSRRTANHDLALAGLEAYFQALGTSAVETTLVLFSNDVIERQRLTIEAGSIAPLRAAIGAIPYDGGTQMAVISPGKREKAPDAYFVVSDGLSNFGGAEPAGFTAPVYCLSVGQRANHIFLRHLAESTGGAYFNLARQEPSVVATAVAAAPLSVTAIDVKSGRLSDLLPPVGRPVETQLNLTGKLLSDTAIIEVKLGRGNHTLRTLRYEISRQRATTGLMIARLWAQSKAAAMAAFPKQNAQGLVDLGKRYNLVTPGTSMIVLERLEQYVEHQIRPPASLVEMRAAYDQQAQQKKAAQQRDRQAKLERIVNLWKQRIAWWETEFEWPMKQADKERAKDRRMPAQVSAGEVARAAPAAEASRPRRRPPRPSRRSAKRKSKAASSMDNMLMAESVAEAKTAKEDKAPPAEAAMPAPSIELKAWDPDTPYLRAIKAVSKEQAYETYLVQKDSYHASPAFYLDCSNFFFEQEMPVLGLRVLSNVAELEIEDAALMRVVGHRLAQLEYLELARVVFEQVKDWRPEEPQSYRDLALVLAREKSFARAMELLAHVVMGQWDRFAEIELIALMELNNIIPKAKAAGITNIPIDSRLCKLLDVDIRISLSWDADLTDMDIWVFEPTGEKAYYSNNRTQIGGLVSRDFTQGYGPEEYMIRRAMPGTYTVKTNFYGSSAQTLTGAVTVQLELFTNYGRPNEERKATTLRLSQARDTITVGTFEFNRPAR